ncbi:MAG: Nif3-like dinuclear metal center hexameric protein [Lachnospiraceae bacterium]|nr:Nif3-like dinuclear metal center hexameric protein [Lachnospiraceae bacterium]
MVLSDIMQQLEDFCPASFAQDWDNPGLQAGRRDLDVKTVFLAVDATSEVIDEATAHGAQLILTHHPLLFDGIKHVTDADFVGKRIVRILQKDMALFAMHTNFDVMAMGSEAAEKLGLIDSDVLEVTYEDSISHEGFGRIGELPEHESLQDLAEEVKEVFDIPHVRFYGDPDQQIVMAAVMPGAGKGEMDLAASKGADVLITGDINHHAGIDAVEKGIAVIDAGHYGIEKLFVPYMKEYIEREMPELKVVCARVHEPFHEV